MRSGWVASRSRRYAPGAQSFRMAVFRRQADPRGRARSVPQAGDSAFDPEDGPSNAHPRDLHQHSPASDPPKLASNLTDRSRTTSRGARYLRQPFQGRVLSVALSQETVREEERLAPPSEPYGRTEPSCQDGHIDQTVSRTAMCLSRKIRSCRFRTDDQPRFARLFARVCAPGDDAAGSE
jgi:hypothetical protein